MKAAIVVALGLLVAHASVVADTGFLDRSVTIGAVTYRYQVYVPAEHTRAQLWPVIVDLHGGGSQGPDGLRQTAQGLAQQIRLKRSRFPAVVVFPQAEVGKWWLSGDMEELVMAELDRTVSEFGGDPARLYLTGFSMGATGAYRIAYRWPTRFAALAMIAGRVDTFDQPDEEREADRKANQFVTVADPFAALAAKLKPLPIRIFHGDADERVPVEHSRRLVAALKTAGGNVQYREFPGATHVGAAGQAYADETLVSWLLAQRK
jgi:predicted peptidase